MNTLPFGVHNKLRVMPIIADTHSRINISHLKEHRGSEKCYGLSLKYCASPHPEIYWMGGSRISLKSGESMVINHNREVQFDWQEHERPFLGMCIHFQPKDVAEVLASFYYDNNLEFTPLSLAELPEVKFEKGNAFNLYLQNILTDLMQEPGIRTTDKTPFYNILEQLIFTQSSSHLKRLTRLQDLTYSTRQELIRRVMQADHYMRSDLSESHNLESIARQVGMSPYHFQRQYKKATGVSPTRQLAIWRLGEAKKRIKNSKRELLEIATEVGYIDLPTFSKAFKRQFGYSPSYIRKK